MPPSKIACYCRVRTEEQNIDRQLESTHDHAQSEPDADLKDVEIYQDKSTGTDTAREGYRDLMADVDAGSVDTVVDYEISRLARSLQDLDRTVKRVTGSGTEIHFGRDNLRFTGEDNLMTRLQM